MVCVIQIYNMNKQRECSSDIHISIVSHGQWHLIRDLLQDLDVLDSRTRFQVTLILNVPESEMFTLDGYSFPVRLIENTQSLGFAENHNQAFQNPVNAQERKYFFVINPDVRINQDVFPDLVQQLESNAEIGVLTPVVVNDKGVREDSIRILPTPWIILKKVFQIQIPASAEITDSIAKPDWIAGMFMGFRSDVFKDIQGFDDKFFLYYEDVDICSRLWLRGLQVRVNPNISIVHNAQRDSHGDIKYLKWHLNSMLHFFLSKVYRKVKRLHAQRLKQ